MRCAYLDQRGPERFVRICLDVWAARPFDDLARVPSGRPVTLCDLMLTDAVDLVVDREPCARLALSAFRRMPAAISAGSGLGAEALASRNA